MVTMTLPSDGKSRLFRGICLPDLYMYTAECAHSGSPSRGAPSDVGNQARPQAIMIDARIEAIQAFMGVQKSCI